MKTVIVDTNGYLRLFLDDIPKQADKIEKLVKRAENGKLLILVPQIIPFEINFVLQKYYQLQKNEIIEKLETLIATPHLVIESREIFVEALAHYKNKNISFTDAFLLSKSIIENAELITFDKKLKNLALSI